MSGVRVTRYDMGKKGKEACDATEWGFDSTVYGYVDVVRVCLI